MAEKRMLTENEVRARFGVTEEQLDAWERDASEGIFHGEPRGGVVMGRPTLYGAPMRQVGFRETASRIDAMDRRASSLGMRRSEYLRHLVSEDLRHAESA